MSVVFVDIALNVVPSVAGVVVMISCVVDMSSWGPEVVVFTVVVVTPVEYFETSVVSPSVIVVMTGTGVETFSVTVVDFVVTGDSPEVVLDEMVVTFVEPPDVLLSVFIVVDVVVSPVTLLVINVVVLSGA